MWTARRKPCASQGRAAGARPTVTRVGACGGGTVLVLPRPAHGGLLRGVVLGRGSLGARGAQRRRDLKQRGPPPTQASQILGRPWEREGVCAHTAHSPAGTPGLNGGRLACTGCDAWDASGSESRRVARVRATPCARRRPAGGQTLGPCPSAPSPQPGRRGHGRWKAHTGRTRAGPSGRAESRKRCSPTGNMGRPKRPSPGATAKGASCSAPLRPATAPRRRGGGRRGPSSVGRGAGAGRGQAEAMQRPCRGHAEAMQRPCRGHGRSEPGPIVGCGACAGEQRDGRGDGWR
jgi:hypothetical protein